VFGGFASIEAVESIERRERDPENPYIYGGSILPFSDAEEMPRNEFYISKPYVKVYEKFRQICRREGRSPSRVICEMMREYVMKHEHGNPQKQLVEDETPPIEYSRMPVIRRKQVIDDLLATVKANPGVNIHRLIAKFSEASGLRRVTLQEYMQTLVEAGRVRITGHKVYPR